MEDLHLGGLSLMKQALLQMRQNAIKKEIQEQENQLNISKNKISMIGNNKSYIQGNYSPSPSKINQNSFITNAKILNNLDSPIQISNQKQIQNNQQQNISSANQSLILSEQKNGVNRYGQRVKQQQQQNISQQNFNNQNFIQYQSHQGENNQFQLQQQQQKNNNFNNINSQLNKSQIYKASDHMEQIWLRQTIDQLCEDNRMIHTNLEDAMKVIEKLREKISTNDLVVKQLNLQKEFSKQIYEKYSRQLKENERLRDKLFKCRNEFFNLKQKIIKGIQDEFEQNEEDKKMIDTLIEENQKLRGILKINFSDEQINKFEKQIDNEEGEFFSQFCNQDEKLSEVEIKYLSKRKNSPAMPNKNFHNSKEFNLKPTKTNQFRGDISSLLGNQFSQQIKKGIEENISLANEQESQKQEVIFLKNSKEFFEDLQESEEVDEEIQVERKLLQKKSSLPINNIDQEAETKQKILFQQQQKQQKDLEEKVKNQRLIQEIQNENSQEQKDFNENEEEDDEDERNSEPHNSSNEKNQNPMKLKMEDEGEEEEQQGSGGSSGGKRKNVFMNNQSEMDQNQVERFLKQMNYRGNQDEMVGNKGYLADFLGNHSKDQEKKQFFEYEQNQNGNIAQQGTTIEYEEYDGNYSAFTVEEYYEDENAITEDERQLMREMNKKQEILKMKQSQMELQQSFLNFEEKLKKRKQ